MQPHRGDSLIVIIVTTLFLRRDFGADHLKNMKHLKSYVASLSSVSLMGMGIVYFFNSMRKTLISMRFSQLT